MMREAPVRDTDPDPYSDMAQANQVTLLFTGNSGILQNISMFLVKFPLSGRVQWADDIYPCHCQTFPQNTK